MIKINLTPPEELENPLWMVPDVLLAVLVCIIGYFGVNLYLDSMRVEIDVLQAEQAKVVAESTQYVQYVEQLKRLDDQIAEINKQLNAIKGISGELVEKYSPVIAIEHVQNLKPQGVWLKSLNVGGKSREDSGGRRGDKKSAVPVDESTLNFEAYALDNLLVAEFMASLRATKTQSIEASDMRTQVFFTEVSLTSATKARAPGDLVKGRAANAQTELPMVISFTLNLRFKATPVKGARTIASFHDFYPADTRFDLAVR